MYCMRSQQITTKHAEEEEAGGRKRLDASDKNKIREDLQKHTNRIFAEPCRRSTLKHHGTIAPEEVNVDNTLATGQALVYQFMANLPKGFHTPIEKEVVKVENLKEN